MKNKLLYLVIPILCGFVFSHCSTDIPNGFPSDPYPDAGTDIVVVPTSQPDTVIPNGDWQIINPNEFRMGKTVSDQNCPDDALPVHPVELSGRFAIMRYEVTADQFRQFVNANKDEVSMPQEPFWKWVDWKGRSRGSHPVVWVSWKEAKAFAEWVGGRLPTEAEWEHCARAGQASSIRFSGSTTLDNVAFYYKEDLSIVDTITVFMQGENEVVRIGRMPRKVGSWKKTGVQPANAWGIYDMSGNVMEWCNDWYGEDYYQLCREGKAPNAGIARDSVAVDPKGPSEGMFKIIRGGGWNSTADFCTVYIRLRLHPGTRSDEIGFRVVKDL